MDCRSGTNLNWFCTYLVRRYKIFVSVSTLHFCHSHISVIVSEHHSAVPQSAEPWAAPRASSAPSWSALSTRRTGALRRTRWSPPSPRPIPHSDTERKSSLIREAPRNGKIIALFTCGEARRSIDGTFSLFSGHFFIRWLKDHKTRRMKLWKDSKSFGDPKGYKVDLYMWRFCNFLSS